MAAPISAPYVIESAWLIALFISMSLFSFSYRIQ
jgi:hypothetical protein